MKKYCYLFVFLFLSNYAQLQVSLVKDFFTGSSGAFLNHGNPTGFTKHNGKLYLSSLDNANNTISSLYELSDLSGSATKIANGIGVLKKGANGSARVYEGMVSSGNNLFFFCQNTANTDDILYVYNGSAVIPLDTIPFTFLYPYTLLPLPGGKVAYLGTSPATGMELWMSDGTLAGTQLLKDINPGTTSAFGSTFVGLTGFDFQGKIYFGADNGLIGNELWVSDGTPSGTNLFVEFNTNGAGGSGSSLSVGFQWAKNDNRFLIALNSGAQPSINGVISSDGTIGNTTHIHSNQIVSLFSPDGLSNSKFVSTTSNMYYAFGSSSNVKIYRTLGVPNDTVKVYEGPLSTFVCMTEFMGNLYSINQGSMTSEILLNKIDVNTGQLSTLRTFTDSGFSNFAPFRNTGSVMFFQGKDQDDEGVEFYTSDGTSAGTQRIYEFAPSALNGGPNAATGYYIDFDNNIAFTANSQAYGKELWKLGGTAPVGLEENDIENNVSLYPNPASDLVHIELKSEEAIQSIRIMDLNGMIVLETTETDISISNLNTGVYLVAIECTNKIVVKKLLVKH